MLIVKAKMTGQETAATRSVLISSDGRLDPRGTHVGLLEKAGFDVRYSKGLDFPRGLVGDPAAIEQLRGVAAVVAWGEQYTRGVLAGLPDLRVIARIGVGLDNVDIPAATERGIAVTITPTANHEAVAEHALALLFAVAKSIPLDDKTTRSGEWPIELHQPIRGKTLGIVGLGRIGRSVAVRALAMRMKIIAVEKYPDRAFVEQHGIELMDLDTVLARSDYVSLHCPLSDETRGLINRQRLGQMRPDSVLINTARGGLVVEDHLLEALVAGQLRAAALDVFEREPTNADNPLFQLDNVVVSSHTAGSDTLAMENMAIEAAQCIIDLSRGRWPELAAVNGELRKTWEW